MTDPGTVAPRASSANSPYTWACPAPNWPSGSIGGSFVLCEPVLLLTEGLNYALVHR